MKIGIVSNIVRFMAISALLGALSCALLNHVSAQVYYEGYWNRSTLVSAELIDGKLHIVKRTPSNVHYPEGGGPPDSITKYIYAASNGVVVLERTVAGTIIPPSTTPEKIEWPDKESKKVEDVWKTWKIDTNMLNSYICTTGLCDTVCLSPTNLQASKEVKRVLEEGK